MIASFGALDPSSFPTRDMLQIFQKIGVVFKETSEIQPWEIALERMTSQMEKNDQLATKYADSNMFCTKG